MDWIDLAVSLTPVLEQTGRLVRLPDHRATVFVGDTHGDLDAVDRVIDRFPPAEHTLVFLGDTVDRGPDSAGTLERILREKAARPDAVHLLMGNHEGWAITPFSPADFWERLSPSDAAALGAALLRLPIAAWHRSGVLGLHGALPDLGSLEAIASIEPGSAAWRDVTWGDWTDDPRGGAGAGAARPTYGRAAFETRARRLGVRVLVRSHQPHAPTYLFEDRCLTLFTSHAYGGTVRRVAVLPPGRPPRTARDLLLVEVEPPGGIGPGAFARSARPR